jgi:magnesium-transporting ATPase (P-type)
MEEMTEAHKASFEKAYELFAGSGQRVLAFAVSYLDQEVYPETFTFEQEPAVRSLQSAH